MSTTTSTTMCKRGHGRRISYYHTHTAEPHGGSARDLRRKICAPTERLIGKAKTLSLHRSRAIHSISVIMMLLWSIANSVEFRCRIVRMVLGTMCGVAVEGCSTPNTEYLQYVSRYYYCSLFQIYKTTMTQTRGRSPWVRSVVRCTGEVRVGCWCGGDEGM